MANENQNIIGAVQGTARHALSKKTNKEGTVMGGTNLSLKNMTKEERYKWDIIDEPGDYMLVDKRDLTVDPLYQRELKELEIADFVRDWSWVCCGTLIVIMRNGKFFVVDGQQRLTAATRRSDISQLPCMVFSAKDEVKNEAEAFLRINKHRAAISGADNYKAALAAEDETALRVEEILGKHGMKVGKCASGITCGCAALLMRLCAANESLFEKCFAMAVDLHAGADFSGDVLKGLFTLERHLRKIQSSETIFSAYIKGKIFQAGLSGVKRAMAEAHAYWHKGGANVNAQGVLDVVNLKRRQRIPNIL